MAYIFLHLVAMRNVGKYTIMDAIREMKTYPFIHENIFGKKIQNNNQKTIHQRFNWLDLK